MLRNQPLEQVGTNQASMKGTAPSGIESAVAMREHVNLQNDRHTDKRSMIEEMVKDFAEHLIEVARDLYVGYQKDIKVSWNSRIASKKINWSEVDPVADLITIKIASSSILARGPSGRKALAQELGQAGLIGPQEALRLMDIPDINKEIDLGASMIDLIDFDVEVLRDRESDFDQVPMPDDLVDSILARKRVVHHYAVDKVSGAPSYVLSGYRRYIKYLDDQALAAEMKLMEKQAAMAQAGVPIPQTQGFTMPRGDLAPGISPV
jgi:hypothetical protein